MNTERIPAKKVMEPGMSLNDIDNIWDYIDMYVEEETPNAPEICLDDEDDFDDECWMTAMIRGKIMMVRIWKIMTGGRIIMMLLRTIQKQNGVENGK